MWVRFPTWVFWGLGFLGALPLVLDFAGALWWVVLPVLAVICTIHWFWGMKFVLGEEDFAAATVGEKAVGLLIALVQLFIGVVFAVFIVTFLVQNWVATILTLLLLVVVGFFAGRESKPKLSKVLAAKAEPQELVPEPSHEPLSTQDWLVRHLSVLVLLGLGGAAAFAMAMKRQDIASPFELAAFCAYVVVAWIHIVGRGEPGKPPHSILARIGYTFMTVIMTIVGIVILIVICQAVVEFWMWVLPPVAILAFLVAAVLLWDRRDAEKKGAAAQPTKSPPRKRFRERRDEVIR